MNIEQIITDELREVGATIRPPAAPDPAVLVQKAEQARVRTLVRSGASVVLAAAAVLAIILLGAHLGNPKAAPPELPQPTGLTTGAAPAIPYQDGVHVYAGGAVVPGGSVEYFGEAGHYRVAELGDSSTMVLVVFRDGDEVERLPGPARATPVLSEDGSKLAYLEHVGSTYVLVSRDLDSSRDLGRLELDPSTFGRQGEAAIGSLIIDLVEADGTVHYETDRSYAWKPGGTPKVETTITGAHDITGYPEFMLPTSLNPDQTWGAWLAPADGAPSLEEGGRAVYLRAQQANRPDTLVSITLPPDVKATNLRWETETDVLVVVDDDATGEHWHFLRCSITTKHCELAPKAASGG